MIYSSQHSTVNSTATYEANGYTQHHTGYYVTYIRRLLIVNSTSLEQRATLSHFCKTISTSIEVVVKIKVARFVVKRGT